MMPMESYLENTVNTVIENTENTVIGKFLKTQKWKVECQWNAFNGKLSGEYSEREMRKGSGRCKSQSTE